jgi:hypothetical protein
MCLLAQPDWEPAPVDPLELAAAAMVGSYANRGGVRNGAAEGKLDELRRQLGEAELDSLKIAGVGAWGSLRAAAGCLRRRLPRQGACAGLAPRGLRHRRAIL